MGVTAGSACAWTAASNADWITVTGGARGTGNGTASFTAAANTGAPRSGTLTVAGQTFTINQAESCTFSVSPTQQNGRERRRNSQCGGEHERRLPVDGDVERGVDQRLLGIERQR